MTAVALIVFVGVYALIVSERIHRTLAALLGASVVMILGVSSQERAFGHIDLNVIFGYVWLRYLAFR